MISLEFDPGTLATGRTRQIASQLVTPVEPRWRLAAAQSHQFGRRAKRAAGDFPAPPWPEDDPGLDGAAGRNGAKIRDKGGQICRIQVREYFRRHLPERRSVAADAAADRTLEL